MIGKFSLIHSVDTLELAQKIAASSVAYDTTTAILLQVNTSGEETKHGLSPEAWKRNIPQLLDLQGIDLLVGDFPSPGQALKDGLLIQEFGGIIRLSQFHGGNHIHDVDGVDDPGF